MILSLSWGWVQLFQHEILKGVIDMKKYCYDWLIEEGFKGFFWVGKLKDYILDM